MVYRKKAVKKTSHINFDEHLKTFRLYAKDSLYAFCLSPELTLEHLYWGKKLQEGYDLRYLSQGCRVAAFNTVEAAPHSFDGKIRVEAETLEEVQKTWKENRVWSSNSLDDVTYTQKKRLENYSWRILSQLIKREDDLSYLVESKANSGSATPRRSELIIDTRRRAISTPIAYRPTLDRVATKIHDFPKSLKMSPFASKRIETPAAASPMHLAEKTIQTFERQLGKLGKGALCVEYNDHGTGDFRSPSFVVVDHFNGSAISPLRYRSHKIYKGKIPIEGMPSIRCLDENEASTLVVTLVDAVSGLEVDLIYSK